MFPGHRLHDFMCTKSYWNTFVELSWGMSLGYGHLFNELLGVRACLVLERCLRLSMISTHDKYAALDVDTVLGFSVRKVVKGTGSLIRCWNRILLFSRERFQTWNGYRAPGFEVRYSSAASKRWRQINSVIARNHANVAKTLYHFDALHIFW